MSVSNTPSSFPPSPWSKDQQLRGEAGKTPSAPSLPPAVDYTAAMAYMSDNNKTTALAQIMSQEFALQQASLDRQMQMAAGLELGLERLDTSLQVGKLQYIQNMTAEQNRHAEKLAEMHTKYEGMAKNATDANTADLPAPDFSAI